RQYPPAVLFPSTTLFRSLRRHGRAFDVPARPSPTPRRGPGGGDRLFGLVRLPQREVPGVLLAPQLGPLGQLHVLEALVRQRTVRSEEHTSELQSRFDLVC